MIRRLAAMWALALPLRRARGGRARPPGRLSTRRWLRPSLLLACIAGASPAAAQLPPEVRAAVALTAAYEIRSDVVYDTRGGIPLRLDAYVPLDTAAPRRTLLYFHGGGWVWDTKERNALELLPYLAQGWTVVSVEYRRAGEALAPAAVVDARCAFRWVAAQAANLRADPARIVVSGHSAGGHLALMAALAPSTPELDDGCPWPAAPRAAAVVNWFGITDVADLLGGPHRRDFAATWIGPREDGAALARRLSPLAHVRADLPPVISVHGDADDTVPYAHAVRLHAALQRAGVPNALVTVPRGGHAEFPPGELMRAYEEIDAFLKREVPPGPPKHDPV